MDFMVDFTKNFRENIKMVLEYLPTRNAVHFDFCFRETRERRKQFITEINQIIEKNPDDDLELIKKCRLISQSYTLNKELFVAFYEPFDQVLNCLDQDLIKFKRNSAELTQSEFQNKEQQVVIQGENKELVKKLQQENKFLKQEKEKNNKALVVVEQELAKMTVENSRLISEMKSLCTQYAEKLKKAKEQNQDKLRDIELSHEKSLAKQKIKFSGEISEQKTEINNYKLRTSVIEQKLKNTEQELKNAETEISKLKIQLASQSQPTSASSAVYDYQKGFQGATEELSFLNRSSLVFHVE